MLFFFQFKWWNLTCTYFFGLFSKREKKQQQKTKFSGFQLSTITEAEAAAATTTTVAQYEQQQQTHILSMYGFIPFMNGAVETRFEMYKNLCALWSNRQLKCAELIVRPKPCAWTPLSVIYL